MLFSFKIIQLLVEETHRQHFIVQLMHTMLKNEELLKHFKIRKLLQHILVYKGAIIGEPPPVLG